MSSPFLIAVLRLPLFLLSILPTISAPPPPPTEYDCLQSRPSASNPFLNRCGRFNATRAGVARRIVGGSDAYRGQLPWHADLDGCGGTIVGPYHVLTAAHCVQDDKGLVGSHVHVGHVLSIRDGFFNECTRQTRLVTNLQVHPCYCGDRDGCGDDIVELQYDAALLTIETPFYFNDFVQPACLPVFDSELTVGTWTTVSGFGHEDYDTGETPDSLQFVKKPIVSAYDCKRKHNDPVTDDMLCAGFDDGGKDACVGDSGGPLVVVEEEKPVVVVGVVSWGIGCAEEWPGVYSKVSHVVDWIEDAMKDVEDGERRKRRRRRRSVNVTSKRGEARRGEGAIATDFNQEKCSEYLQKRDIDECKKQTCNGRGTCQDKLNDYACNCVNGYTGKDCETDIDECKKQTCNGRGTCQDKLNDYACKCVNGYTGKDCETAVKGQPPTTNYFRLPPSPNISVTSVDAASTASSPLPSETIANPDLIFQRILDFFPEKKIPLILIERSDIIDGRRRLLNDNGVGQLPRNMRFGVLGENLTAVNRDILPEIGRSYGKTIKILKTEETIFEFFDDDKKNKNNNNFNRTLVTNIFIILRVKSRQPLPPQLAKIPFYPWRRLHLRFLHRRGRKGYRWMGQEADDEGNFKLPAEAYDDFRLKPLVRNDAKNFNDKNNTTPFFLPADLDFFLWQKESSEFRECNLNNLRLFNSQSKGHKKGNRLKEETKIMPYIKTITAVESILYRQRILTWLNCGLLLGWFRQCSIIPGDGDVDLTQWNSFDDYPALIDAFKNDNRFVFKYAKIPFTTGHNKKGDQSGFYIRLNVKGAKNVDVYFNFKHKIYDVRAMKGSIDSIVFKDSVCSADLHGFLVHVPCNPEKIDEIMREKYPGNYFKPGGKY